MIREREEGNVKMSGCVDISENVTWTQSDFSRPHVNFCHYCATFDVTGCGRKEITLSQNMCAVISHHTFYRVEV